MPRFSSFVLIMGLASAVLFSACQNNQSKQDESTTTEDPNLPTPTQVKVSYAVTDKFSASINQVIDAYLATKDALVAANSQEANLKVGDLIVAIQQADAAALNDSTAQKWNEHRKFLERAATSLQAAGNLEAKRASFEDLSKAMYALVTDFGSKMTLYKEYCPMAFNDKGAFWLSSQSNIRNPYFGNKMLECGEVQEVLQFNE